MVSSLMGPPGWSGAAGDAGPRLLVADEDVLDVAEGVEGVGAELAADAGLLGAAEGRPIAHGRVRVHREGPGLDGPGHPEGPAHVAGPERAGESVGRVVGQADRILLVLEGD